jgi:hypothetical protein
MKTIGVNAIEVIITIGFIYGVLKYWNWKLKGGYDIEITNRSYGVFLFSQIFTMLFMIISGLDPQNQAYMEHMNFFGDKAFDLWTVIGIQIFGLTLLFMLSNIIGILLFKIAFPTKNGLFEDIREDNLSATLVASVIIFTVGYTSSMYVLRPFILDWVSRNAGLIPLN